MKSENFYPYQLENIGKKYEDTWSKSFYMNVDDLIAWLKDIGINEVQYPKRDRKGNLVVYDGGVWLSEDETKEAIEDVNIKIEDVDMIIKEVLGKIKVETKDVL